MTLFSSIAPPSLSLLTLNALAAADRVLIPIQCEYYALEGVTSLMNTINRVKRTLNPALDLEGVLLTMLDGRTNLGLQVVDEVKKHFRKKVFATTIPRNVRLGEAPSHGEPIHLYDPPLHGRGGLPVAGRGKCWRATENNASGRQGPGCVPRRTWLKELRYRWPQRKRGWAGDWTHCSPRRTSCCPMWCRKFPWGILIPIRSSPAVASRRRP